MALLSLTDAHLAYGHVPLLDGAALALEPGERFKVKAGFRHFSGVAEHWLEVVA